MGDISIPNTRRSIECIRQQATENAIANKYRKKEILCGVKQELFTIIRDLNDVSNHGIAQEGIRVDIE